MSRRNKVKICRLRLLATMGYCLSQNVHTLLYVSKIVHVYRNSHLNIAHCIPIISCHFKISKNGLKNNQSNAKCYVDMYVHTLVRMCVHTNVHACIEELSEQLSPYSTDVAERPCRNQRICLCIESTQEDNTTAGTLIPVHTVHQCICKYIMCAECMASVYVSI